MSRINKFMKFKNEPVAFIPPQSHDNHTPGVIPTPDYSTDPSNKRNDGKTCFTEWVAPGEGTVPNDVKSFTPSGVSHSRGQGNNNDHHYNEAPDRWNDNRNWDGANLTGF